MERSKKRADALLKSFNGWMADRPNRPLRQVTRYQYVSRVKKAMRLCEKADVSFLAGDVRTIRYVLGTQSPHPASQNMYLCAFRAFFDFLVAEGIRKDNPARDIGRPPKFRGSPRPLPIKHICAYLEAADRLSIQHTAVAVFGLYMGLRRGEMRRLRWADFFQVGERWWCDAERKGGQRKRTPVPNIARYVVEKMRQTHTDPTWVFPSVIYARAGQPVGTDWIRRRHLEILAEAKLPHYTPHALRHSFATYLKRSKRPDGSAVDITVVQKALGHNHLSSTMIYTEILDSEVWESVEGLDYRRDS